jgi:transposase-like protein
LGSNVAQHFLLSRAAKSLSLAQVFRMTDAEAETAFKNLRWTETNGAPVSPICGSPDAYEARRPNGALRFRCRGCKKDFTVTSGTLFASHKLPLKSYLAAIAVFCNEVKGQVRAGSQPRSGRLLQVRVRPPAQVSRSHG